MSYRNLMIVTFAALLCPNYSWGGPILTGAHVLTSDASGTLFASHHWDTESGNASNLWVIDGSDMLAPFLNGPSDEDAAISVELLPGTRTFSMFGNGGGEGVGYWGIRLYINGENTNPAITVYAATDTSAIGPDPSFFAAEGTSTLTFQNGEYAVTVTDFRWSLPTVDNLNRVDYRTIFPSEYHENPDYTGQVTLVITQVPEPSALILTACALLGLACGRHRP